MSKILTAAHQASGTSDDYIINLVVLFIVLCWSIGIVDAYRIGKNGREGKLTESSFTQQRQPFT